MIRTVGRRHRNVTHRALVRPCSPVVESLEPRQLLSATSSIDLISVASDASAAAAASGSPSVSSDGKRVVFTSTAALVPGVTANGDAMVYLRDRDGGTTALISKASDGSRPNAPALEPRISADGKFVVYASAADNLVAGDANGHADIFFYDIEHDVTRIVSAGGAWTVAADGDSSGPTVSSDGHYVAFTSVAGNLVAGDTNGAADAFFVDTTNGDVKRVSTDAGGVEGNAGSTGAVLAADGGFVAFLSDASNLVSGDTNAVADVFLKNVASGAITRISVSTAGGQANGASGRIAINATGTVVAFESDATNLVSGDTNGLTDVFLRDVGASQTTRISVGPANTQANGASTHPSISANGQFVVYTSVATNIDPSQDTNGKADVFLYDNSVHSTRRIGGRNDSVGNGDSDAPAISGDGKSIAFRSDASDLVSGDVNGFADVFLKDLLAVPKATVTGTPDGSDPHPILDGDTSPVTEDGTDFGIIDVSDAAGVTRTFTITNTGADRLVLSGTPLVRITGANPEDFAVSVQPGVTGLDPGETVTFDVTFNPSSPGRRTATITFTTNNPDDPTYTFAVSGVATDATITSRMIVTQGTASVPTGSGSPFSFGSIAHNGTDKVLSFTVTNVSAQTITLDPVTLTDATGFEIAGQYDTTTLAPGDTATFTLRMKAATLGDTSATVNLSNSDGTDTKTASFDVSGKVVTAPKIVVLIGNQELTSGQTVDFGSVVKGSSAGTKVITIRNDGETELTLGALSLPAGYTVQQAVPQTVQPGKSISFTVQLDSSTAAGTKAGTLSLPTNDPSASTFTLSLTGVITVPEFELTVDGNTFNSDSNPASTSINFGTAIQGRTGTTKTITITNNGTAPLAVSLGTLPPGFKVITAPNSPVAPGDSVTFVIGLSTDDVGSPSGSLDVNHSNTYKTSGEIVTKFTLNLSGIVIPDSPKAVFIIDGAVAPGQSISFGTVRQRRARVVRTITVRNDGTVDLVLGKVNAPAGYTVVSAPEATTLAPGESTTFTVAFTPLVAGVQTGILTIATNESARSAAPAGLTATVTPVGKKGITVDSVTAHGVPAIVLGGMRRGNGTAVVRLGNHSSSVVRGSYRIKLYAADGTYARPGVDKVLGSATVNLNLAPGGKMARAVPLSFPAPPADGGYHIVAVVRGAKADRVHNFNRAPFVVRVEKPQAKIGPRSAGAAPITAALGTRVTQQVPIANSGNLPIGGSLTAQVWLSKDGTLMKGKARRITTVSGLRISMPAKGSQTMTVSFTLPEKLPPAFASGKFNLLLKVKAVRSATAYMILKKGILRAGKITIK